MATKNQTITNVTNHNQLTSQDKTFYDRVLLERLIPELQFYADAMKKKLPKNEGRTTNFRRFNSLPATGLSLTEGLTPDGKNLDITVILAVVQQYGAFVTVTDLLQMTGIDPVITEAAQLLGEQAALNTDLNIRATMATSTNVHYAGGKTSIATIAATDVLTGTEVMKVVRNLKNKNARRFADGFYHGIVSPDQALDLMKDPMWVDIGKYANNTQLLKGEIGKMHGVRFVESTIGTTQAGAAGTPVHTAFIYGRDSYAVVDLENGNGKPSIIVKPNGSAGTEDPLNQRASVGWKNAFTSVITQPNALVAVNSAASA